MHPITIGNYHKRKSQENKREAAVFLWNPQEVWRENFPSRVSSNQCFIKSKLVGLNLQLLMKKILTHTIHFYLLSLITVLMVLPSVTLAEEHCPTQ